MSTQHARKAQEHSETMQSHCNGIKAIKERAAECRGRDTPPEQIERLEAEHLRLEHVIWNHTLDADAPQAVKIAGWAAIVEHGRTRREDAAYRIEKESWIEEAFGRRGLDVPGVKDVDGSTHGDLGIIRMLRELQPGSGKDSGEVLDRLAEHVVREWPNDNMALYEAGTVLDRMGTDDRHAQAARHVDNIGEHRGSEQCKVRLIRRDVAAAGADAPRHPDLRKRIEHATAWFVKEVDRQAEHPGINQGWRSPEGPLDVTREELRSVCEKMGTTLEAEVAKERSKAPRRRRAQGMEA